MSNPHFRATLRERIAPDVGLAAEWLHAMTLLRGRTVVASIGPAGTSAHDVLSDLKRHHPYGNTSSLDFQLYPSFEDTMQRVLDGTVDYALIPSAYRDATAFHWHPRLELASMFVHRTPDYGLAARHDTTFECPGTVVVAAMSEVEGIFSQLAPDHIVELGIEYVMARSTSDAAAKVGAGAADIAVCNDLGREEHGLSWIDRRRGAEMVWMFFQRSAN